MMCKRSPDIKNQIMMSSSLPTECNCRFNNTCRRRRRRSDILFVSCLLMLLAKGSTALLAKRVFSLFAPIPLTNHRIRIQQQPTKNDGWRIISQSNSYYRSILRIATSESEFPSQEYHQDPEDEWDSSGSGSDSSFHRRIFEQKGLGAIPKDRHEMIMHMSNEGMVQDDDEWESYLNMDLGMDEDGAANGSLDTGNDDSSQTIIMDRVKGSGDIEIPLSMKQNGEASDDTIIKKSTSNRPPRIKHSDQDNFTVIRTTKEEPAGHNRLSPGEMKGVGVTNTSNEPTTSSADVDAFRKQFSSKTTNNHAPDSDEPLNTQQPATKSQQGRRITTDEIAHIKSSISLVDVIESYNLPHFTRTNSHHTSSASAKACCPFHDDNNPSMSIDDSRGLYKCFACGAGGDVFNFIREYDYLDRQKSGKEKMGYMQAVEYAAREFGDGNFVSGWSFGGGGGGGNFEGLSEETKEKIRAREFKKERIRQANTAAAAFYTKCLVTLNTAGKARAHLRSRNISPDSIRTFAIGYAPDCYYGDEAAKQTKTKAAAKSGWGAGSLVEYLGDAGFSPDEIVEAGLAVRTKKSQFDFDSQSRQVKDAPDEEADGKTNNAKDDSDNYDYSGLMDRFRSRLIIPIMDESGQNVIALGGRYLEPIGSSDDTDDGKENSVAFTPAKYINSPDSLVFTKKNVLFNRHIAKLAIDDSSASYKSSLTTKAEKESDSASKVHSFDAPPAVIIVEGYFDVIALSNVGVRNVVASMGTALPVEQLQIAAEMGNVPGGRIIICMDGDDAGMSAVERLCSSNILSKVPELNRNELYVASLPGGQVKDPSDFVDFAGGGEKARDRFQEEILNNSIPWDEWYVEHLLSKHDRDAKDDTKGSFSSVCDEVSTFLASFPNPADRTRRVHKIAEALVELISEDDTEKSSSSQGMLRVQLESDILNMSSRKAGVREAMERRIEQTDGFSGDAAASKMERLTTGHVDIDGNESKMSKKSLARLNPSRTDRAQQSMSSSRPPRPVSGSRPRSFRSTRQPKKQLPERHLVPHFKGFTFKHQTDRDWLGLSGNRKMKPKMHLGETPSPVEEKDRLRAETPIFENRRQQNRKKEDIVYFNSNRYLGHQYLSPDAIRAGYELGDDKPSSGESIVEFTGRKLFQSDPDLLILQAESRLLHALAKFPQARAAMRTVYSSAIFGPSNMRWTSKEREWLFLCLTGSTEIDPPLPEELLDGGTPSQLHVTLANRQDCPDNAFNRDTLESSTTCVEESPSGVTVEITSDSPEQLVQHLNDDVGVEVIGVREGEERDSLNLSPPVKSQHEYAANDEPILGLLDEYFLETDMFPSFTNNSIAKETRAELTVQETVATLLRASAMKRFSVAKSKLTKIVAEMDRRLCDEEDLPDDDFSNTSSDELQELFQKVGNEVVEAQKSLYDAERSSDRVNSHLLDYSVSNGVQYKLSQAQLERLDKMMEDHIASLPEDHHRPETPGNDGLYEFGSDEFDDEIDEMYGGRNPDEYVIRGLPNGESKWD